MNSIIKKSAAIAAVTILGAMPLLGCSSKHDSQPSRTLSAIPSPTPTTSTAPDGSVTTVTPDPTAGETAATEAPATKGENGNTETGTTTGGNTDTGNTNTGSTGNNQPPATRAPQPPATQPPAPPVTQAPPPPVTQAPPPPPQPDYCPGGDYTGNNYDGSCGVKPEPKPDYCPGGDYSGNNYDGSCGTKPRAAAGLTITSCAWEPDSNSWRVRGYVTGEPGSTVSTDIWINTPWGEKHFTDSTLYIGTSGSAPFVHGVVGANSPKNTCGGSAWY